MSEIYREHCSSLPSESCTAKEPLGGGEHYGMPGRFNAYFSFHPGLNGHRCNILNEGLVLLRESSGQSEMSGPATCDAARKHLVASKISFKGVTRFAAASPSTAAKRQAALGPYFYTVIQLYAIKYHIRIVIMISLLRKPALLG